MSEKGERTAKKRKFLAYAEGCNPDVDPFDDWWDLARNEMGGDDFAEYFESGESLFLHISSSEDDLEVSATEGLLTLQPVAPRRN